MPDEHNYPTEEELDQLKKYCGHFGVPIDIACYALTDCQDCKLPDWKGCEKYRLFLNLNIPVAQEETAGCPYEN